MTNSEWYALWDSVISIFWFYLFWKIIFTISLFELRMKFVINQFNCFSKNHILFWRSIPYKWKSTSIRIKRNLDGWKTAPDVDWQTIRRPLYGHPIVTGWNREQFIATGNVSSTRLKNSFLIGKTMILQTWSPGTVYPSSTGSKCTFTPLHFLNKHVGGTSAFASRVTGD